MILKIYLATVIVALISFMLDTRRINKYLAKQELRCSINIDTLICILLCFIPVINIFIGHSYYYFGVLASDEEFESHFND